uniref:Protein ripply3 n=1 Tax=Ursus maritimus TaxID=29073 RepID=A0A452SX81_URSMA
PYRGSLHVECHTLDDSLCLPCAWGSALSSPTPWRPWILTPQEAELTRTGRQLEPGGDRQTPGSKGAFGFQHPVRLYLPISKRQEYLQSSGEKVLASFPVQATIHFYNDESDSDDEEQEEETQSSKLQCQEAEGQAENGPGGKGRGQLTNPGWSSVGHSDLGGKGPLPHGDSLGGTERASPK